jgi:hypothetical protein
MKMKKNHKLNLIILCSAENNSSEVVGSKKEIRKFVSALFFNTKVKVA